jgi:Skp family chaperone for outer membrane proteins
MPQHKSHQAPPPQGAAPRRAKSQIQTPQRIALNSLGGSPVQILQLQRTLGNRAVGQLLQRAIQAKLTVGPVDDPYEEEADHVADQVMRPSTPQEEETLPAKPPGTRLNEEDEVAQMKPALSITQLPAGRKVIQGTLQDLLKERMKQQRREVTGMSEEEMQEEDEESAKEAYNRTVFQDPAQFLRTQAGLNWDRVRDLYKEGRLAYDETLGPDKNGAYNRGLAQELGCGMNELLAFRLKETLLKTKDTGPWAVGPSIMQQVNDDNEAIKDQFTWNYGAGTASPSSDIDSNLAGYGSEQAVALFNQKFREKWGKEAGVVFDVNVYARDYLPIPGGGALALANLGYQQSKGSGPQRITPRSFTDTLFEYEKKGKKETTQVKFEVSLIRGSLAYADVMDSEELYSLVKTRMDMTPDDWRNYKRAHLAGISGQHAKKDLEQKYAQVEKIYTQREQEITAQIAKLPADPDVRNQRMKAENLLYAKKLKKVGTLRAELKALESDKTARQIQIETKYLELTQALHEASIFANEAYVTGAAVQHVVGDKQILSNKAGDPLGVGKPKEKSNLKILLTADQYMHSFNEQIAFIFKELELYANNLNKALLKASKYIYRMGNAAKHISKVAENRSGAAIVGLEAFRDYGKQLLGRKLEKVPAQDTRRADQLPITWAAPNRAPANIAEVKQAMIAFSVNTNKVYRVLHPRERGLGL